MLDDQEPPDSAVSYAPGFLQDWMFATFPAQESEDTLGLPILAPASSDSPGPSNMLTQGFMELPGNTSANQIENNQLDTSRLLTSPDRQPSPEASNQLISNPIDSHYEVLFQMCKSTLFWVLVYLAR